MNRTMTAQTVDAITAEQTELTRLHGAQHALTVMLGSTTLTDQQVDRALAMLRDLGAQIAEHNEALAALLA